MEYLGNVLQARIADISSKSNSLSSSLHNDIVKPGSKFNYWGTITAQVKAVVKLLDVDTKPLNREDKSIALSAESKKPGGFIKKPMQCWKCGGAHEAIPNQRYGTTGYDA